MKLVQNCRPENHNSISHSIFRVHVGFLESVLCEAAGLVMWWSVNRCYDQYITNRLMGNGAEEMVAV